MVPPAVSVKVWGEFALFTRPELKVERLSYPLMTPSAARGVLDAILFRPQMCWHVRRITVLDPWSAGPPSPSGRRIASSASAATRSRARSHRAPSKAG